MKKMMLLVLILTVSSLWGENFSRDTLMVENTPLVITCISHGSLLFEYGGKTIYIDPSSMVANFAGLPKADYILITHHHRDHLDSALIEQLSHRETTIILNQESFTILGKGKILKNGEEFQTEIFHVSAIPAYNLVHVRENGEPFHPKGRDNGYVLTFGKNFRVYIAGDTENTPEMKALQHIDIAFLPMNLPYTMTPEMVADAVRSFKPRILYPYHYGKTDPARLKELLADFRETEIRIRPMQ